MTKSLGKSVIKPYSNVACSVRVLSRIFCLGGS